MFEAFAGEFLRRVEAEFAAAGDFAGGVVEHVGRAFGEEAVALRVGVGAEGSAAVPSAGFGVSPKPSRGVPKFGWRDANRCDRDGRDPLRWCCERLVAVRASTRRPPDAGTVPFLPTVRAMRATLKKVLSVVDLAELQACRLVSADAANASSSCPTEQSIRRR